MVSRFFPNAAFHDSRHQWGMWVVSSEAAYVGRQISSKERPIWMRERAKIIMVEICKEILREIILMFEWSITMYAILSWWIQYICSINHTKWLSVIWWRSLLCLLYLLHLLSPRLLAEHVDGCFVSCCTWSPDRYKGHASRLFPGIFIL